MIIDTQLAEEPGLGHNGRRRAIDPMIGAAPRPDELAAGHIGRLRALNEKQTNSDCIEFLRRHYAHRGLGRSNDPVAHVVAALCQIPPEKYLRLHTMLPFTAFAMQETLRKPNGSWANAVVTRSGLLSPRQGGYACPACVAQDEAAGTISYWRRTHQLPSELWCSTHPSIPLVHIDHPRPFERVPRSWLGSDYAKPIQLSESFRENEFWRAFEQACRTMLEFGESIPVKQVRCAIVDNAAALGLRTTSTGKRPVLSDLLRERAPEDIARHFCPELLSKAVGAYVNSIDKAAHLQAIAPHSTATAIAIALLFNRASDALTAFQRTRVRPISRKLTLTQAFLHHKGNTGEIARTLGMSEAVARVRLRGISRQINPHIEAERHAVNLYRSGMPLSAACAKVGADREFVDNLIRARLRGNAVGDRRLRVN